MTPHRFGAPPVSVLGRGLAVLLLVALPASLCRAQGGHQNPFAGLDSVNVTLEIRGPLDLSGSEAPRMFTGDLKRRNHFQQGLIDAVAQKIETCGIMWDQSSPDAIAVEVFGRQEPRREAPPLWVYMVEVGVFNRTLTGERAASEPVDLRPVIGVVDDAGLERALTDAAIAIVSDDLTCR